jgi:hypothetical protein
VAELRNKIVSFATNTRAYARERDYAKPARGFENRAADLAKAPNVIATVPFLNGE